MVRRLVPMLTLLALWGCSREPLMPPADEADFYLRKGSYARAIELATQAVEINPMDSSAYVTRGRAYQCRNEPGDLTLALADFDRAVELAPESPEPYYSRALAFRARGDNERADTDEARARQLDARIDQEFARYPEPDVVRGIDPEKLKIEPQESRQKQTEEAAKDARDEYVEMYNQVRERLEEERATKAKREAAKTPSEPTSVPGMTLPTRDRAPANTTGRGLVTGAGTENARGPLTSPTREASKFGEPKSEEMLSRPALPPPVRNPWARQPLDARDMIMADPSTSRTVQSPFRQPTPGPTGYVPPTVGRIGIDPRQTRPAPANPFSPLPQRMPNSRQLDQP